MEKDTTKQFTIVLGEKDYLDLTHWAYSHGKTPAEYASQILSARIEANQETIEKLRQRHQK
jgi:succinate dehydrogenase flavin-adding protein (antitoxin of CptAB toxin-antitoxin module)